MYLWDATLAIGLMVNAKKSLSSCQLARDVGLNTKIAWFMQQRIRAGMAAKQASPLQGIVEMDEPMLGDQPRKENRREEDPPGDGAPMVVPPARLLALVLCEMGRQGGGPCGQQP